MILDLIIKCTEHEFDNYVISVYHVHQIIPLSYFYLVARISFSQSEFMVVENEEVVKVELVRSGDTSSEVIVLIANQPYQGSAAGRDDNSMSIYLTSSLPCMYTAERDYISIIEIITFESEELTKTVDIHIIDDTSVEFDENFFLQLTSGEGVHISPFGRAEVIITNDDGKQCRSLLHALYCVWF